MRKIAIALAFLAYVLPLVWQLLLWPEPGETVHGMFWFVTTAGSLVLAAWLSGIATALLVSERRDCYQPVLGSSAFTRAELAFVAAPVLLVFIVVVLVLVT